jgi:hypothetical protein
MTQPVLALLSHQQELADAARRSISGDANEASLMVGEVITRALRRIKQGKAAGAGAALLTELDLLIDERRPT